MGSVRSPRAPADLLMELARGIEPPTCGLQNRCSAVELRQRPRASAMYGSILHYGEHYLACVIARSTATKQSRCGAGAERRDCFASLAMTGLVGNAAMKAPSVL